MLVPSGDMKRSLEAAAQEYHDQLNPEAVEYLKERGITKEIANSFRLGFVDHPMKGDDMFKDRISIPYLTRSGIVAIKYRSIHDAEPKYIYNPGATGKRIFNPHALFSSDQDIYLCEGEMDTITAVMCGFNAAGIPGVSNWDKYFRKVFRNRRVIVLADGDDAGQGMDFAKRVLSDVDWGGIILFEDEDVNSFFVKHGRDALIRKINS